MAAEKPNTIRVQEVQSHEVAADRADLSVTVEGASLLTGQEALHKAREVAQTVRGLTEYGLPPESIYLESVHADKSSGMLSRTSQARYRLRVHCADLKSLADLLGIITSQKNATLNFIGWGYPDDAAQKDQWLAECLARANAKAALIAAGLGVRLLGIHAFSEKYLDPDAPPRTDFAGGDAMMGRNRAMRLTGEDLGLEISHTKKVEVSVEGEYLVSTYEPAPTP